MDYKEKYNAALRRAKKLQETCDSTAVVGWCEYIFPELKESEDERIRKEFYKDLRTYIPIEKTNKYIAWLEKQGKQEPYGQRKECFNCQFNYAGECKGFCQMKKDEQEPADKVEPKFHGCEWLCVNKPNDYAHLVKIIKVVDVFGKERYKVSRDYDSDLDVVECDFIENNYHLWTIQDAKDGDILAVEPIDNYVTPFVAIYANRGKDFFNSHCFISFDGQFCDVFTAGHSIDVIHPATKEQRDLLFQKMKQEGYEWDSDKKELKKIESKMLDADKVIEWLRQNTCAACFDEPDEGVSQRIDKFKTDFELW